MLQSVLKILFSHCPTCQHKYYLFCILFDNLVFYGIFLGN